MDNFFPQYITYSLYKLYIFSEIVNIILIILTIFISCFILYKENKKIRETGKVVKYEERTFGKVQKRNEEEREVRKNYQCLYF